MDDHRNSVCQGQDQLRLVISLHISANKHHQQISISCLLGSLSQPVCENVSLAWPIPTSTISKGPLLMCQSLYLRAAISCFFGLGKVRSMSDTVVTIMFHHVSSDIWSHHIFGKTMENPIGFWLFIVPSALWKSSAVFLQCLTISQHPRPPVDLVLAFLPLDHGHIGIGTALGIFLKNRGICQPCHHVTRTIIKIEKWHQVTNQDFFHAVKKWLWDA